jgi:peroxiredoxin Q/BCP
LLGNREFKVAAREKGSGLGKFDAVVFTASVDPPETMKKYAAALKLDYAILSDPSKDTATAYGVVTKDRAVPFRWTFYIGTDGKILHVDKEVSARTHGVDIATKLGELGVKKK